MPKVSRGRWIVALAFGALLAAGTPAAAASRCDHLLAVLGQQITDVSCVESSDLTTNNPATTPPNDSLPGLPPFAFTPQTDREVISPSAPNRTPITKAVPGIQLDARISDDPAGEARILFRLPIQWNGKLVVAGASRTRSEFNGDFAWSDYVVQQGYAYVSQNKGVLNLYLTTAADPLGCRLNPLSAVFVHFYANDPGQPFTRWTDFMVEATRIGKNAITANYGRPPHRTYAVGTSNGGYQVRRALEAAPELFDGGVDWESTYVDPVAPNLLSALPPRSSTTRTTRPAPSTRTAPRRKILLSPATLRTSCRGQLRSGAYILPSSGKSRSANGKNGWIRHTTPTDLALEPIATSLGCPPPMSVPTSPTLRRPARSASR
jgi:hypothetical protein